MRLEVGRSKYALTDSLGFHVNVQVHWDSLWFPHWDSLKDSSLVHFQVPCQLLFSGVPSEQGGLETLWKN